MADNIPISRRQHNQVHNAYMSFLNRTVTSASAPEEQLMISFEKQERNDGLWRILLVDDEPVDQTFWADIMRWHGCIVHLAGNGEDALKLAADEIYGCILLDVISEE